VLSFYRELGTPHLKSLLSGTDVRNCIIMCDVQVRNSALFDVDPQAAWPDFEDDDLDRSERPATPEFYHSIMGAIDDRDVGDEPWMMAPQDGEDERERPYSPPTDVDAAWLSFGNEDYDTDDSDANDEVVSPLGQEQVSSFPTSASGPVDAPQVPPGLLHAQQVPSPVPPAEMAPPPPPPSCGCFTTHPDARRPMHYRIESPYCPLLPWPEFREEPCICYATALEPSTMIAHSDVTSPHCPFNVHRQCHGGRRRRDTNRGRNNAARSRSATARSRARSTPCTSCGQLGHATDQSSDCPNRISGRVFQPFVQGNPGRKYHDEDAPTLSARCPHCKCTACTTVQNFDTCSCL
jgi:hypothetical protein